MLYQDHYNVMPNQMLTPNKWFPDKRWWSGLPFWLWRWGVLADTEEFVDGRETSQETTFIDVGSQRNGKLKTKQQQQQKI